MVIMTSLAGASAEAQPKAPPNVCNDKLSMFLSGQGHDDVAGDLDWFATYCEPAIHESAINAVAEATMNAALEDAQQYTKATGAQIKAQMAEAHHGAAAATAMDMLGSIPIAPAGPVVVVNAGGGPRPMPPPPVLIQRVPPPPPPRPPS